MEIEAQAARKRPGEKPSPSMTDRCRSVSIKATTVHDEQSLAWLATVLCGGKGQRHKFWSSVAEIAGAVKKD